MENECENAPALLSPFLCLPREKEVFHNAKAHQLLPALFWGGATVVQRPTKQMSLAEPLMQNIALYPSLQSTVKEQVEFPLSSFFVAVAAL